MTENSMQQQVMTGAIPSGTTVERSLGQLLAAQSVLLVMPGIDRPFEFGAQVIASVPGVSSCGFWMCRPDRETGPEFEVCKACPNDFTPTTGHLVPLDCSRCSLLNGENVEVMPVGASGRYHGALVIQPANDSELYRELRPFLQDFVNVMGLVIENNLQKAALYERAEDSEERYRHVVEGTSDLITIVDTSGKFAYVNPVGDRVLGISGKEAVGLSALDFVHPDDRERTKQWFQSCQKDKVERAVIENRLVNRRTGRCSYVMWTGTFEYGQDGTTVSIYGIARDITELRRAEEERRSFEVQLQQAQKFESLGILAGGIAHDFNNLLMAILGNVELVLQDISPVSPARPSVTEIETAARKAADLTRQMLDYSGRGACEAKLLDLSELVSEMPRLPGSSVSHKIRLTRQLVVGLPPIRADASQMQQIVTNLITNASEAIGEEEPGEISVSTGMMMCDSEYLAQSYLTEKPPEGQYVFLEVKDTGCGMDERTKSVLFDPFFTTKFTGRGLGLAAVLGIVRGHQGAIMVDTELGKGSTFRVLFPPASAKTGQPAADRTARDNWHGAGTILVVDDDESVRKLATKMVQHLGFEALPASDGQEALAVFRQKADTIRCVILDLTMPGMDGGETSLKIQQIRQDVPILLSSGYSESELSERFDDYRMAGFLQKPYKLQKLRSALKAVFL